MWACLMLTALQMIIVTSTDKPLEYTPKGTPKRKKAVADYTNEINAAYDAVEESAQTDLKLPTTWSLADSTIFVRNVVQRVLGRLAELLDDGVTVRADGGFPVLAALVRVEVVHRRARGPVGCPRHCRLDGAR